MCKVGHLIFLYSLSPVSDPVSVNIRRAMANVIAVVLATPHQSTHLWYHMFKPEELCGTHMTAFLMVYQVFS